MPTILTSKSKNTNPPEKLLQVGEKIILSNSPRGEYEAEGIVYDQFFCSGKMFLLRGEDLSDLDSDKSLTDENSEIPPSEYILIRLPRGSVVVPG